MAQVKGLDGELIVDVGHYDVTVIGLKAVVYYCKVTVIKAVTQIVRGGAWKACLDARGQLQGLVLGKL